MREASARYEAFHRPNSIIGGRTSNHIESLGVVLWLVNSVMTNDRDPEADNYRIVVLADGYKELYERYFYELRTVQSSSHIVFNDLHSYRSISNTA